jgi:TolA-binding protein
MKRLSAMLNTSVKLAALAVLVVSLSPTKRAAAAAADADLLERGKQMYMHGDYPNAGLYLEKEIAKNPKDACAHYLLGNVLFAEKRLADAAKEYQQAATLAPNSAVGQYSRLALSTVASSGTPATLRQPALVSPQSSLAADDPEKEAMKSSVRAISRQADQQQQELSEECQGRLRDIQRDADNQLSQMKAEMESKQAANGQATYGYNRFGRRFIIYDPGPANSAIQDEYQRKMDAVRNEASKKSDELTAYFKTRQSSVNESALRIDKGYLTPDQNSRVKISPMGTNMYTRNYQTKDEPSGNPVPVMAPPAKSLQQSTGKSQH